VADREGNQEMEIDFQTVDADKGGPLNSLNKFQHFYALRMLYHGGESGPYHSN
jgi:hypothetical protein